MLEISKLYEFINLYSKKIEEKTFLDNDINFMIKKGKKYLFFN